jgi:Spy/CpxP family protein refolding chaperone
MVATSAPKARRADSLAKGTTVMKKILLSALAVVALAVGLVSVTAFRHHGDPARLDKLVSNRLEDLLDEVHATDAQRQQITAVKDKLLADGKALHAGNDGVHQQLLAQWQSNQPNAAQVHALVDGRAAAMTKFADEVADAMIQVHGILTPDQRAQITKKLQRHMQE